MTTHLVRKAIAQVKIQPGDALFIHVCQRLNTHPIYCNVNSIQFYSFRSKSQHRFPLGELYCKENNTEKAEKHQ